MKPFARSLAQPLIAAALIFSAFRLLAYPQVSPVRAASPCRAADLDVVWGGVNGATGGQEWGVVLVSNHSDTPCELSAYPFVEPMDDDGQPIDVDVEPCTIRQDSAPPSLCSAAATIELPPSALPPVAHLPVPGQIVMPLSWRIHDGAGNCFATDVEPVPQLRLTISSGDQIPVTVGEPGFWQSEAEDLGKAACGPGRLVIVYPFQPAIQE